MGLGPDAEGREAGSRKCDVRSLVGIAKSHCLDSSLIKDIGIPVKSRLFHRDKSAVQGKHLRVLKIDPLAGLIDQHVGNLCSLLISVKADKIIRLFVTRICRAVESRMSADGKIQRLRIGRILYAPLHSHLAALQAVCDGQFKGERILCPALFIVAEAEGDRIRCLFDQGEIHVPGKAMLAHRITLSLVAVKAFVHLADKGKQYRCMPVPVGGVSLPHDFVLSDLIINAAQLRTMRGDRDLQKLILDDMHFISHGFPPSLMI